MDIINGYTLKGELKNANSGFSKWGFATKNGKEYFIKELINPVYPLDKSIMPEEMFQARRSFCAEYEEKFKKFFEKINEASRGNLVRIIEFFRCGSRYYLITEKIEGKSLSLEEISTLPEDKKILLIKTAAQAFADLHSAGIVHFDVKPNNILVKKTKNGNYAAKLIDFDSGFSKDEKLKSEDLGGDLTHLAPETFLAIYGEDVKPDEKADIFGLGLVFHEYFCGHLPYFDENEYEYPYEATLDGGLMKIASEKMPEEIANLITSMIDADPSKRPSAEEAVARINEITGSEGLAAIKQISIHFNGHYGKSISVTPEKIRFRNTLHPTVREHTKSFPESYTAQLEKSLSESQFENIVNAISEAGLSNIIAPHVNETPRVGAVYQTIAVTFEDGTIQDYSTFEEPIAQFNAIAGILSGYCEFPEIDSSWYENGGGEIAGEEKVIEEKESTVTPENDTPKTDNWFKFAGDL